MGFNKKARPFTKQRFYRVSSDHWSDNYTHTTIWQKFKKVEVYCNWKLIETHSIKHCDDGPAAGMTFKVMGLVRTKYLYYYNGRKYSREAYFNKYLSDEQQLLTRIEYDLDKSI